MKTEKELNEAGWRIENSYTELSEKLYNIQNPTPVKNPNIILFNNDLAIKLGLDPDILNTQLGATYFSGNLLPLGSIPLAQGYAGHQFGHFTMLGDGRAILLGEQISPRLERYDVQLKGSGKTPYSRSGDGRATLSSMLREYIISEAMNALGVPTTRSLSIVVTGENVYREKKNDGAILTRVSKGHIRVGTFQLAALKDEITLRELADYSIKRFYPESLNEANVYLSFLEQVIRKQAELVAKWQSIGFIHGVMNTDNVSIVGETIDYGPCAFMDTYHHQTVFSSIDNRGRYAYVNQPGITQWNLARFAETLLPLLHQDENTSLEIANNAIAGFQESYESQWLAIMGSKIGIFNPTPEDKSLIVELLNTMESHKLDFTNTFISLMDYDLISHLESFNLWLEKWHKRLALQQETWSDSLEIMQQRNPTIIPRNHQVEKVLTAATTEGDLGPLKELVEVLSAPFTFTDINEKYMSPPADRDIVYETYCGT